MIIAAKSGNTEFLSGFEFYKLEKLNLYYYDNVEPLIKKGAENYRGFIIAIEKNDLIKFEQLFNLKQNNNGITMALYEAVKLKRWAFVEILEGENINYNTCFRYACEQNNLELIKYFIKKKGVRPEDHKHRVTSTICKLYFLSNIKDHI
jgi:ankyrin repeat protein